MNSLEQTLHELLADIAPFAAAGGRELRPYQLACARAIVRSVLERRGRVLTVMFARQMGKNELSAQLEAYLLALFAARGGSLVKAAPSFRPQVINSLVRLRGALEQNPLTRGRAHSSFGYQLAVGSASVSFYSAEPHANVVGATASLLLEIDEAQDVDPDKYDRDFRPMAATTNATTVLYGTAWSEESILQRQKLRNLEIEARTGERLHFEYDWTVLADMSGPYREYVTGEIGRLGYDHPTIRTQYLLHCLGDAGRLFSLRQQADLQGAHARESAPDADATYVMGIDLAGEDEEAEDAAARALSPRRDSTVVTIASVDRDDAGSPRLRVVEHVWWTGRAQVWQFEQLAALCEHWRAARICVDAGGVGAGIAAFLAHRLGPRVEQFVFTAPSKSALAYGMLGLLNSGRLQLYAHDFSAEALECRREIAACRYWLRAHEQLSWGVPPTEGHDDFVASLALCCRAAEQLPVLPAGRLIRSSAPSDSDYW